MVKVGMLVYVLFEMNEWLLIFMLRLMTLSTVSSVKPQLKINEHVLCFLYQLKTIVSPNLDRQGRILTLIIR